MRDDSDRCPYDRGSADDVRSAFDRLSPEPGSDALPLTNLAERSKSIPARRAATLRCACQAATLAHLRARFDLATHSKTPAARLGSAARKAGSHLRLPRCSCGPIRGMRDGRTTSA